MTACYSNNTTKSGVKMSLITVTGRINELSFTGEFVTETEMSWVTCQENGISSDEWRKEYSRGLATQTERYATPKLRMLQVGRSVSYTSFDIVNDLQRLGLSSVEELWKLVILESL